MASNLVADLQSVVINLFELSEVGSTAGTFEYRYQNFYNQQWLALSWYFLNGSYLIIKTALPQVQNLASVQNSPRRLYISIMKKNNGQMLIA